jgi:hypothetical protein
MKQLIERAILGQIERSLFKGKVVIVYGARQVGKTTLVRQIERKHPGSVYVNADEPDIREALTGKTSSELRQFFGNSKLAIIDEAQRVRDIGMTLKLLVDTVPDMQIIATGSSSFELAGKVAEPLTGRKFEFHLYPLSFDEMAQATSGREEERVVEARMVFGSYPEVVFLGTSERERRLRELAGSYLYKDILAYQDIRNPDLLERLLRALALQVGNEVSFAELAETVGANKQTVTNYVRILEHAFIVFRLGSFARNLRNELKKKSKIYFYDVGVRNALVNNFNALSFRQDTGALWENYLMVERMKWNHNSQRFPSSYFWRTFTGKEIDYIEEEGGTISGFEFKWRKDEAVRPKEFAAAYPGSSVALVNRENFQGFVSSQNIPAAVS